MAKKMIDVEFSRAENGQLADFRHAGPYDQVTLAADGTLYGWTGDQRVPFGYHRGLGWVSADREFERVDIRIK